MDSNSGQGHFQWKTFALWSGIVAVVSLTALAVVSTLTRVDALSVVALALAVMAFVVQIIVFIVQGKAASQQAAETSELNAQTLRALATIEEKSEGTRQTVGIMNERILDFAFTKARTEAESDPSGMTAVDVSQLLERAKEIIQSSDVGSTERQPSSLSAQGYARLNKDAPASSFLDEPLSSEELEQVEQVVQKMSENVLALVSLTRLGNDLRRAEAAGVPEQAGLHSMNEPAPLHEAGLVKRVRPDRGSVPMFVLTDKGKLVAKALISTPPPLNEAILKARRVVEDLMMKADRHRAEMDRTMDRIPVE